MLREWSADARGVGAEQIQLQFPNLLGCDADVAQFAHAGCHRVCDAILTYQFLDDLARCQHLLPRVWSEQHGTIVIYHLTQVCEGESFAVNVQGVQKKSSA